VLGWALVDLAVIAAAWAAMALTPPVLMPLWVLVVAGRLHALGVLAHELVHQPQRRWPVLQVLVAYPVLTTVRAMRYHHLRHHRHARMPGDPYLKAVLAGRPALRPLYWLRGLGMAPLLVLRPPLGLLAWALPGLRTAYGRVFLLDVSSQSLRDSPEVLACARAELGQLGFLAAVGTLAAVWPWAVLWGYGVPALVAGSVATVRLLGEHPDVHAPDHSLESVFATTRDQGLGVLGTVLLAPHHIGFHVAHHLHPTAGMAHLPALRTWYRDRHPRLYGDRAPIR